MGCGQLIMQRRIENNDISQVTTNNSFGSSQEETIYNPPVDIYTGVGIKVLYLGDAILNVYLIGFIQF